MNQTRTDIITGHKALYDIDGLGLKAAQNSIKRGVNVSRAWDEKTTKGRSSLSRCKTVKGFQVMAQDSMNYAKWWTDRKESWLVKVNHRLWKPIAPTASVSVSSPTPSKYCSPFGCAKIGTRGGGRQRGRGEKETLARKPRDSEKTPHLHFHVNS